VLAQRVREDRGASGRAHGAPEETSVDVLELKDDRIVERYSQPQRVGTAVPSRALLLVSRLSLPAGVDWSLAKLQPLADRGLRMSSTQQPQPQAVRGQGKAQSQGMGKLIAAGVIAVLLIILILQNSSESWRVHFFFWWFSLPAWLMLVLVLVVGFLIGFVLSALLRRRKKRELRRRAKNA